MADTNSTVKDLLIALYNRNEQYHDFKDTVIWLAASAYLGFSIAIVAWILNPKNRLPWNQWYVFGFLILVFATTFVFIVRQNCHKCISVRKTGIFDRLILELARDESRELKYQDLVDFIAPPKSITGLCSFFVIGWPGVMILLVVMLFFIAQIVAVFHKVNFSSDRLGLGIFIGIGAMVGADLILFLIGCYRRKKAVKELQQKISSYIGENIPKELENILKQSYPKFEDKLVGFTKRVEAEIAKRLNASI